MSENPSQVLEATESFAYQDDATNRKEVVQAGTTRVSAGSDVAKRFPQHFRPIELSFSDVEEATDEPGHRRARGRRAESHVTPPVSTQ